MNEKIVVLITTDKDKRGVFKATIARSDIDHHKDGDSLLVEDVQMCVYWSTKTRGVLGLASIGPQKGSRVTKPVKRGKIHGVTAILEMEDKAIKAWEDTPWE